MTHVHTMIKDPAFARREILNASVEALDFLRSLQNLEHIHHKNGVRDDNQLENLELWTVGHKDPPGTRVIDHLLDRLHKHPRYMSLKKKDRVLVELALREIAQPSLF